MGSAAEEFERKFDAGEDISKHLDLTETRRPRRYCRPANVDSSSKR